LGNNCITLDVDRLAALAAPIDSGLESFVIRTGRWPVVGENPPPGYLGDTHLFKLAAAEFLNGFYRVDPEDGELKLCIRNLCSLVYFDPAELKHLKKKGHRRFPFLPACDASSLRAYSIISVNAFLKREQRTVRLLRKSHVRPPVKALPRRQAGSAAPSAEEAARTMFQNSAVADSAVDSQPCVSSDEDDEGDSGALRSALSPIKVFVGALSRTAHCLVSLCCVGVERGVASHQRGGRAPAARSEFGGGSGGGSSMRPQGGRARSGGSGAEGDLCCDHAHMCG
jgi:hypothetical protein